MDGVLILTHEFATFWVDADRSTSVIVSNDDEGRESLAALLRANRVTMLTLLVDIPEEEFRIERVPHVLIHRHALAQRVLHRLFGDAPFCQYLHQEREQIGRCDDVVLFSSLTRADLLERWLSFLAVAGIPLRTVVSVPLIAPAMIRTIAGDLPSNLLVVFETGGGLRQILLYDGRLRFSRAMPVNDTEDALGQVQETLRFLQRHGSQAQDAPRDVLLLGAAADLPLSPADLQIHRLSEQSMERRLSGAQGNVIRIACAMHAAVFHGRGYSRPEDRRRLHEFRRRLAFRFCGWAILVLAGVLTPHWVSSARIDALAATRARQQLATMQRTGGDIADAAEVRSLRDAVQTATWLRRNGPDVAALERQVRGVFRQFPEFTIAKTRWTASTRPVRPGPDQMDRRFRGLHVDEDMIVVGELRSTEAHRHLLHRLKTLEDDLGRLPYVSQVEILEYPWDLDPAHSFVGGLSPKSQTASRFSLRLRRGGSSHGRD